MSKMSKMSKIPRYTRLFLLNTLRKQLKDRSFDREAFKLEFGLDSAAGDRRVRRLINEVAKETALVTLDDLVFLKNYCIQNLTIKAANRQLDEATELKIALSGETQKFQVQQQITENKTVNLNVKTMLTEYECVLNNEIVGVKETVICTDHTT